MNLRKEGEVSLRRVRFAAFCAWLVLLWEALWPLLWPIIAGRLGFLTILLLEIPSFLPVWLQIGFLLSAAMGLIWGLARLRNLRWPRLAAARRRLERDSNLSHRPLDNLGDDLALGGHDPEARALWREHQRKLALLVRNLRLGPPRPDMELHDQSGLRFVAFACFSMALIAAGGDAARRFEAAFVQPMAVLAGPPPQLQVWITPPAYAKSAPTLLDMNSAGRTILVVEGSALMAELQGGRGEASLLFDDEAIAFSAIGPKSQRLETTVKKSARLSVRQGWGEVASWKIAFVADNPPDVALLKDPTNDLEGRLNVSFEASDDYALVRLFAMMRRSDAPDEKPSIIDLGLAGRPRTLDGERKIDLSAHRWAGRVAQFALGVADDLDQQGQSDWVEITMPERMFRHPVAQEIVTLRRNLTDNPGQRRIIAVFLRKLTAEPATFGDDIIVFMALIHASARLRYDGSPEAADQVANLLWKTALRLEDGDRPEARQALEQAAADLQKALDEGASGAELEALTQRLAEAMHRYLMAVAEKMLKDNPELMQEMEGETDISSADLADMLEQIRQMAGAGSTDAAKEMLSRLNSVMNGLEEGLRNPVDPQKIKEAKETMDALKSIADQQQKLLDQSYAKQQEKSSSAPMAWTMNNPPDPFDLDLDEALDRSPKADDTAQKTEDLPALAAHQERLRQDLEQAVKRLEGLQKPPKSLGQAEQAMGEAVPALSDDQLEQAIALQSEALARLREGMQQAAQNMSSGGGLRFGLGGGQPSGRDPLGRSRTPQIFGDDLEIPKDADMGKAREVLEELRRRMAEPDRTPKERDYLRRLLEKMF